MPLYMIEVHSRCSECKMTRMKFEVAVHAKTAASAMRWAKTHDGWKSDGVLDGADVDLYAIRAKVVTHPNQVRVYQASDLCWGCDDETTLAHSFFYQEYKRAEPRMLSEEEPTQEQDDEYDAACDKFEKWTARKEAEFSRLQKKKL